MLTPATPAKYLLLELILISILSIRTFGGLLDFDFEVLCFLELLFLEELPEDELLPEDPPPQTPQDPPLLQCPHPEQLEHAEQLAEPVHLPSWPTLSLALKQEFKINTLKVIMMKGISFFMVISLVIVLQGHQEFITVIINFIQRAQQDFFAGFLSVMEGFQIFVICIKMKPAERFTVVVVQQDPEIR